MAAAGQLRWRYTFPRRAVRRLAWSLVTGSAVAATAWLLFGTEPDRLASGQVNPLALIPPTTTAAAALVVVVAAWGAVRRPVVTADHYALRIRPGRWRTLVLPWAAVAEIVGASVAGDPVLLVRCAPDPGRPGDRPRWPDRAVLRSAFRAAGTRRDVVAACDVAVRMDDFAGADHDKLASLATWAPGRVRVTDLL